MRMREKMGDGVEGLCHWGAVADSGFSGVGVKVGVVPSNCLAARF